MKTTNTMTFKKTLLGALVISAVTGAFIPWEEYMPRAQSPQMNVFYQDREQQLDTIVIQSMANVDSDALAQLAEDNLLVALNAEIDEQVALNAQAFTEQAVSPEADEPYDQALERDEYLVRIEKEQQSATQVNYDEPLYMLESPLLFAFDSTEINPHYYEALNDSALFMQDEATKQDTIWQVVGYADRSGNAHYNNRLAKKRAQKVAAYLVDKGVDEAQLSIVSLGASNPVNSERSVENNRSERRVEIHRYQAEVTALVEQHTKQLRELAATSVAKSVTKPSVEHSNTLRVIQAASLEQQASSTTLETSIQSNSTETEIDKQVAPINSAQNDATPLLTTAVEL